MLIVLEPFIFRAFEIYFVAGCKLSLFSWSCLVLKSCVCEHFKDISLFLTCVCEHFKEIALFLMWFMFLSLTSFIWMHMWVLSNSLLFSHLIWIISGNRFLCCNALVWSVFCRCTASAHFKIMCVLHNQQLWSSSCLKRCAKMYWKVQKRCLYFFANKK